MRTESVNHQNPIEWLGGRDSNFKTLEDADHISIMHFTLIWSFFEMKVLSNNASSAKICLITHQWANTQRLNFDKFESSLQYFQKRYYENNTFTHNFEGLNLRKNDCRPLVQNVMNGSNIDHADSVTALLIVVYRLRNNLFHGTKMSSGLSDQKDNFIYATQALIAACDTNEAVITADSNGIYMDLDR